MAYVRRDPPVHVVRFVHCVTLMGDYYALLRSRFALCLFGFLPNGCCCSAYWEEMSGLFMPVYLFLYLQTMEKLQLYIPAQV